MSVHESVMVCFVVLVVATVVALLALILFPKSQQTNRMNGCVEAGNSYQVDDGGSRLVCNNE